MSLVPNSRPQMSSADVEKILKAKGINRAKFPVCVLAVRGYYLDSMGAKGRNDRGIFDDAAFVHSPTLFSSVNWNTDPSSYRKGRGTGAYKGMASLKLGVWDYLIGAHKGVSPAGRQADEVTVVRDGNPDYEDTGDFGINLHWGGAGTSSAGCQTAPPNQWRSFIDPLVAELKRYGQKVFKYVLIDVAEMRTIIVTPGSSKLPVVDIGPANTIIKEFEGLQLKSYKDPVGIWTIGWGTIQYPNGQRVGAGETCSVEQAQDWLDFEVREKAAGVSKLVKVGISNNAFCALVSFAYNLGVGALGKSTLLRRLNDGESEEAVAAEFGKWVMAGGRVLNGLVRRRKMEAKLFLA